MNPVVHFEMPYEKRDRMVRLCQEAFGWQTEIWASKMELRGGPPPPRPA